LVGAPRLGRLVGTPSTIGRQAVSVVGPRATLGGRPAGAATGRRHPPGGAGSSQTVDPARGDRPLPTQQPRSAGGAGSHRDVSARWWSPGSLVGLAAGSIRRRHREQLAPRRGQGAPVSAGSRPSTRGAPGWPGGAAAFL